MTRRRRLLVPAISTAVMLAILIALGTWQVQRLRWKEGLLARIDAAEQAPPVPLGANPPPFAKVVATGTLRPDLAAHYGAQVRTLGEATVLGAQLIEPLERPGAPTVLVDLGWVPVQGAPGITPPGGAASVTGFVRPAEHPGWFSATDDAPGRLFYTLDPSAIGAALGYAEVAPFTLVALGPPPPPGRPDPSHALPRPPNNHLQYALTWYGLAVVLAVIFVLYVRRETRA